ncbi:MAG: long-chain fatty acid--CoA ligase [Lentisphaerae bacterium]|nr:long-chain fatty acid--CoA ligase [Lentisphaerota bacterium]
MIPIAQRLNCLNWHADPETGSPFWIAFFAGRPELLEAVAENPLTAGLMAVKALREQPLERFVSKGVLARNGRLITGETSGFSGSPVLTVYQEPEFEAGFVDPFLTRAAQIGFPVNRRWLWAGPCGPHIIGKAVHAILAKVGGMDPYSIDFDPRWYRRLEEGSMSRQRYFAHVEEQVWRLASTQKIEVIFSTPPVIAKLAESLPETVRLAIEGIHYGGLSISATDYAWFRERFPRAVHLSGYGNSLFGMFPEIGCGPEGIEYGTESHRVDIQVVEPAGEDGWRVCEAGTAGRVMMSRYDESVLLLNLLERDVAVRTDRGIRNPHPVERQKPLQVIY